MRDKVLGVIFGTAIGDALGYIVEFKDVSPSVPVVTRKTMPVRYSDDTQMMRAVFEGLLRENLREGNIIDTSAEEVAEEFIAWSKSPDNNRSPGNACMSGCRNLEAGKKWDECGHPDAGGCGTAMRSQAYGVWGHSNPQHAARWAARHALMTHGHPMAQAAAAAVAAGVAVSMVDDCNRNPGWAVEAMLEASNFWHTETNAMLCEAAQSTRESADTVLDRWRGWAGHEAVAASLWCFLRNPDSFEHAVLEAVNSPGDSDSLGAITGALVGARVGVKGIPAEWLGAVEDFGGLEILAHRVCKRLGL